MDQELLQYNRIVEDALRGVVRTALTQAADFGLPGQHSFYITFLTAYPGVDLPDRLRTDYPEEMTIVLEHQFWNLGVFDSHFEVELSFNRQKEQLVIPFAAITSFADPSVPFGLKFQLTDEEPIDTEDLTAAVDLLDPPAGDIVPTVGDDKADGNDRDAAEDDADEPKRTTGEVVNLDAFRTKK